MFNLFPITMVRMTTTMNDVAMQNMFLLINIILTCRTCMKLGGKILNKGAKLFFFYFNTWGTNLGRFLYLCLIEQRHCCRVSMWQIHVAMVTCELLARIYFC